MDMEDGLVYCIKPGGVAANVAAVILAETAMLLAGNKDNLDRSDSSASDENLEDDKTVVNDNYIARLCVSNTILNCHSSICHLLNHQS